MVGVVGRSITAAVFSHKEWTGRMVGVVGRSITGRVLSWSQSRPRAVAGLELQRSNTYLDPFSSNYPWKNNMPLCRRVEHERLAMNRKPRMFINNKKEAPLNWGL